MASKRKKNSRSKKPIGPDALSPWPVLLLAVDPGKSAGWAAFLHGEYVDSGPMDGRNRRAVDEVVFTTVSLASELGVRGVLVVESHPWLGRGARTVAGLGAARGAWIDSWRAAGGSPTRIVSAHPSTWRARTLGKRLRGPEAEARVASAIAGPVCSPDEAAAVCIGLWGVRAAQVGAKLPPGMRRQNLPGM